MIEQQENNSPGLNKNFELQIKTLQNAPRCTQVARTFERKRKEKAAGNRRHR
jgi:hypothetical protein